MSRAAAHMCAAALLWELVLAQDERSRAVMDASADCQEAALPRARSLSKRDLVESLCD